LDLSTFFSCVISAKLDSFFLAIESSAARGKYGLLGIHHHLGTGKHSMNTNYIESRVKTPVGTVLPRLEQWPYPQLSNTTIHGGAARGRRPLSAMNTYSPFTNTNTSVSPQLSDESPVRHYLWGNSPLCLCEKLFTLDLDAL
jgi:hypothetical protein